MKRTSTAGFTTKWLAEFPASSSHAKTFMPTADTSSLAEAIKLLESDLFAGSTRIAAHSDMPFAILRYDPAEEFALRRHLRLLAHSLEQERHWRVTFLSLADFVWKAIYRHEGPDYLFQTERQRGFLLAQRHVQSLVSPGKFSPLAEQIITRAISFSPPPNVLFLVRAGAWLLSSIEAPLFWMSFTTAFKSRRFSATPEALRLRTPDPLR